MLRPHVHLTILYKVTVNHWKNIFTFSPSPIFPSPQPVIVFNWDPPTPLCQFITSQWPFLSEEARLHGTMSTLFKRLHYFFPFLLNLVHHPTSPVSKFKKVLLYTPNSISFQLYPPNVFSPRFHSFPFFRVALLFPDTPFLPVEIYLIFLPWKSHSHVNLSQSSETPFTLSPPPPPPHPQVYLRTPPELF